jgi:hypothetical protein
VTVFDVVEVVDVIGDGRGQLKGRCPFSGVEQLDLQPAPERLHGGVVVTVAHGAERGQQTPTAHVLPETPRRELCAVIDVQNRCAPLVSVGGPC